MSPLRLLAAIGALLMVTAQPVAATEGTDCAPAPDAIVSLSYVSRYREDDPNRDTVDPLREAEAEAAVAPVDEFILSLTDGIDAMYEGPVKHRPRTAACVLSRMARWAHADALSDLRTETVRLTVGARFAAFALILWQTRPYAYDHPERPAIEAWLTSRIREQIAFWDQAPDGSRQGNLRAWAGLAGAALAIQTGDVAAREWASASVKDVICSANEDGSLPQEMRRGSLALHYQLHAIAPLVAATALLERQDVPASSMCEGALHRIVDFAMADLKDGARTRAITGEAQIYFEGDGDPERYQLAWLEPYLKLRHDERLASIANELAPLRYSKLGGNQTALWGD